MSYAMPWSRRSSGQAVRGIRPGGSLVGHVDSQPDLYACTTILQQRRFRDDVSDSRLYPLTCASDARCDRQYLKYAGKDTFYGYLARPGERMFQDDDFAALHTQNNGRTSLPRSLLAKALLLQSPDRVSDAEAAERGRVPEVWSTGHTDARKTRAVFLRTPREVWVNLWSRWMKFLHRLPARSHFRRERPVPQAPDAGFPARLRG